MKIGGRLIVMFIAAVLVLFPPLIFRTPAFALTIPEERKMGDEFMLQMRVHFRFLEDDFANRFINDLGHYLVRPLKKVPFPFRFYIIRDDTLNAFAAPAGHVFFFSGLINIMDTVDELAGVMSHEIGHVAAGHLAQRIEQNKRIGIATMVGVLAGMLLGGEASQALIAASQAAGIQARLNYSRADERQADQLGFKFATIAGFDPQGLTGALKKLQGGYWGPDHVPPYLLTHPTGPERMASLDSLASLYHPGPPREETTRFRSDFPLFKTIVCAHSLEPDDAERIFRRQLARHPDAALPHFGLGIVHIARSEYAMAINELKQALRRHPGTVPILTTLGKAYQLKGNDAQALRVLETVLEQEKDNKTALFLSGISYENMAQYTKAIRLFERLAKAESEKNAVYYHLGFSYGKEKRLALAHYNFGLYFKRVGRPEDAAFHLKKARELCRNNPSLMEKIEKALEPPPS